MPTRRVTAVAATLALAGCGGGSGTAQTGQQRQVLTPGGGKGATEPPIATNPNAPPREALNPPAAAPLKTVRVPVLTYHRVVGTNAAGLLDLKVDPSVFLATLQAIKAAGYHTISDARLFDALYRGRALPPKPLIISVDDGYVDDVRTILPDLQRERMVATFFVITGRMTEPGFLDGAQIVQLDRAGMDVGDHSASRRPAAPDRGTARLRDARFAASPAASAPALRLYVRVSIRVLRRDCARRGPQGRIHDGLHDGRRDHGEHRRAADDAPDPRRTIGLPIAGRSAVGRLILG
jgi:hypothetical protein